MEGKTKAALIVIICIIVGAVALYIIFFGGLPAKNHAKDYMLSELGGDTVECTIEEDYHMCHIIYREQNRKTGEIWIYYYPAGIERYKEYGFKGTADKTIFSDKVAIFLKGDGDFLGRACDLYHEKYGFNCTPFAREDR